MLSDYDDLIKKATRHLRRLNLTDAKPLLLKAIQIDVTQAPAYNLLGYLYELDANRYQAMKFYRVSYYLDQSYKPASDNLERLGSVHQTSRKVNLGE